jgi:hypothetical protein
MGRDPSTKRITGYVGTRTSLEVVIKREFTLLLPGMIQPITTLT